jgi:SAM-dependent methyltransferase
MEKTAVLRRLGFDTFAVDDLSDPWHRRGDNVGAIIRFAKQAGVEFHLQQDGDYSIPFPAESFDVVTIFDVMEHLHGSPRDILNAAGSQLRTGGILCVTVPNAVNLRKRIDVLRGSTNYPPVDQFFHASVWRGHVREFTLRELQYVCEAAGFSVLRSSTFEGNAYDKLRGLPLRLFLAAGRLVPTWRSGLCVVARKPPGWQPVAFDEEAFRRAVSVSIPEAVA